ncbi:probable xyloglucan galactosyltransferase GT11 [Chenopodium quinoa]|uniref:Exostosin GT47 domain-containing protein n=1 Tax=Chenopodium quinoa TaxID=63459 RepID=A0A803LZM2_CHEQI|nr:probable xyloglucan galactosyltransferase GT11 [Chenopodium quinoa]
MVFCHCHNYIWCIISPTFILFCLSLHTYHYLSPYSNTVKETIRLVPVINQERTGKRLVSVQEDPCSGRYIYMHDLPARFNHDLVTKCNTLSQWFDFCPYVKNEGFGPRLNELSWYATNQFMLSVIFYNRMKKYECLTTSSFIASAIYAPFFPGLEVGRFLWGGFNSSVKDVAALDFATWLRRKPEWNRMLGKDHFFVAGRITWDFRRLRDANSKAWGNVLLNLPEAKNMTMLTIESSPYGSNDFAIPYPTYFHPSSDREVIEWQQRVRKSPRRKYLFAFGGAPRPNMTGSVRGELISQCKNAISNSCRLLNCLHKDDLCNSPKNVIRTYMKSDFCLQPPGDSYTRKSTFDSILAGCIPVFFHPGSAYIQYLWHFPKNYTKYSVFIPIDGIKNGTVNVRELLSKIPDNEAVALREEVIRLIPRIIYAQNKLETIEDAFDVSVKMVLRRIEEARIRFREGKEESRKKYYFTGKGEDHEWDSYF